ncbi:hypothetical protein K474DRAFT_1701773 [Panus rudis PR-1116 ss-1]|nr:hypothetical protein K474DRAFT_1701773 [Panus rudis PR-1116 ss-1]
MSVSQETAARSDSPTSASQIADQHAYDSQQQPHLPSETVQPGTVTAASQQGATQPGSGSEVIAPNVGSQQHEPSFKERVVGVAKEIRGSVLNKPETKEQGTRILRGEEVFEPKKIGPKAP